MGIFKKYYASQNLISEISFNSAKKYDDPFNEVEFNVIFTDPKNNKLTIPAFWAGKNIWRVRYSSHILLILAMEISLRKWMSFLQVIMNR